MPIRTIATLAVAVLIGLVAVFLMRSYVGAPKSAPAAGSPQGQVPVVVAAGAIARGATLQPAMLKVVDYPQASVPAGAFHSVAEINPPNTPARLAIASMVQDEPVLAAKVSGPGAKFHMAVSLTPGMRAVTLRSNEIAGVAGFVLPGDRVDILLTRSVGNGNRTTPITQVLMQSIEVLAVDQLDNQDANKPAVARAITIQVTPQQAQQISLAQAVGNVSLSLRQIQDQAIDGRRATTVRDLGFYIPPQSAAPAGAAPRPRLPRGMIEVRVIRGMDVAGYAVSRR
jgi:pilus assembly protein CpaB